MKRLVIANRGLLRAAALAQLLLLAVAGCKSPSPSAKNDLVVKQALVGKDGARTVTAAESPLTVNRYSVLTAVGTNTVTVANIDDLAVDATHPLVAGDLLLIIQMAGATIDTTDDTAAYGAVTALGNAGNYEVAAVASISGDVITLSCNLKKSYTPTTGKAQVIRVPQYTDLTINSGASITARAWDGTVGGVVAVHAQNTVTLTGSIDVTAKGFRGGTTHVGLGSGTSTTHTYYRSTDPNDGAMKGESIAGWPGDFTYPYGRGAPANGGGGGNWHNSGGGGGANAARNGEASDAGGTNWTGQGVMLSSVFGASAWSLDPGYALSGGPGGGRGGYTYSSVKRVATSVSPGDTTWGGNYRQERGGLGGHTLANSPADRLFLGGGGGAGDGNDGHPGPGGVGGGLVFVMAGSVTGTGSIAANGGPGGSADSSTGSASGDGPGGGGGGGTVVVRAGTLTGISSVAANGGVGGDQIITGPEAEGPGGGGGGGYIALSGGTLTTVTADGVQGGTTNSSGVSEFPSNGATAGNDGVANGNADTILYCNSDAPPVAPETALTSKPANPTKVAAATFAFSSPRDSTDAGPNPNVTFECNLDGAGYQPCPASYTTAALPEGDHTIAVRAKDFNGNVDATPATWAWTVDLTPPNTSITSGPPNPTDVSAGAFVFASTEANSTFECQIDGAAYATCAANYTAPTDLTEGVHTLYVVATDPAGNTDATPAAYTWLLDLTAPDTTIATYPPNPSNRSTAEFTFTNSESGEEVVTYECRLDSTTAAFSACPADYTINDLSDGAHTLDVRAKDAAGNVDPTPAHYEWDVETGTDGGVVADGGGEAGADTEPFVDSAGPDSNPAADGPGTVVLDASPDLTAERPGVDSATKDTAVVLVDAGVDAAKDTATGPLDGSAEAGEEEAGGRPDAVVRDALAAEASGSDAGAAPDSTPVGSPDAQVAADTAAPVGTQDAATTGNATPPKLMGSGFCALDPLRSSGPGLFTFFLVGTAALLIRHRRR